MRPAVLLLIVVLQTPTPDLPRESRLVGQTYVAMVPHGWTSDDLATAGIYLEHSSGASVTFRTIGGRATTALDVMARQGVDRIMQPLGFARFGEPLQRKLNGAPAVQYEIHGNRLSERRRLRYIAVKRDDGFHEFIYENSERDYDLLLNEAERIAGSIELRAVATERVLLSRIKSLHTAEVAFNKLRNRYGTLNDLIADNFVDPGYKTINDGYRLEVAIVGRGYLIEAIPISSSARRWAYESREDGVIRYSSRRGLAPSGMAGRPVQ